jgi:hypothetical protein
MLIRLAQHANVERFCEFLCTAQVRVVNDGSGYVSVHMEDPVTGFHELRELIGYVITWNALNPRDRVEVVEPVTRNPSVTHVAYPEGLLHNVAMRADRGL